MKMFSATKSAVKTRFQARAVRNEMGHSVTKELARNGPVAFCSGPKGPSDAFKTIEKAVSKVFSKAQPAEEDGKSYKLLMDRMSSSKQGVWGKKKPVIIQIDATCDEEEDDTNVPCDLASSKAPKPADALTETFKVATTQKGKEESKKDKDEHYTAPVAMLEQLPVCPLQCKFRNPMADRLIAKYDIVVDKFRPFTIYNKAANSVPAWCVLGDIASPDLLAIISTTKPASTLRSCALRLNFSTLKARCAPKPVSDPAAQPTAAVVVAALRSCVLRVKARCASVRC